MNNHPENLTEIYKAILATGWLITDENGRVFRNLAGVGDDSGKKEAFVMLEKAVALPTRENLNASGRDNLLIFHPLMEGLVGGESPIVGKLRHAYGIRATYSGSTLFSFLLGGANHTTEYSKFSPDQLRLFKAIREVDEKTLKAWDKIVRQSIERHGATGAFVSSYIKRNAEFDGQPYSRVNTLTFPIFEYLKNEEDKSIRKDDRETFLNLFKFVFPEIDTKNGYSYGTNSRIAPYLDALLGGFGKVFEIVNEFYDWFSPVIAMSENIRVDLDWVEWFKDIESLKTFAQSVPQQYGNYAVKVEDEKRENTGTNVHQSDNMRHELMKKTPNYGQTVPAQGPRTIGQVMNAPLEGPRVGAHQSVSIGQAVQGVVPVPQAVNAPVPSYVDRETVERQQSREAGKFVGIGRPMEEANGVYEQKKVNLDAVIITGTQVQALADPNRAVANLLGSIARSGGVNRVSANEVNRSVMAGNFPVANVNVNQGMQVQQNNGWGNSPINQMNQPVNNIPMSVQVRAIMEQRMKAPPSAFGSNNQGFSPI